MLPRLIIFESIVSCFALINLTVANADEIMGNSFNFVLGLKDMESEIWLPYEQQSSLGIEFILRKEESPYSLTVEYLYADAEFNYLGREKSHTQEFNVGIRQEFSVSSSFVPFLQAGVSYIKGGVDLKGSNINPENIFNESAPGTYVSIGNTWLGKQGLNQGFKIQKSFAKTNIPSGRRVDLGGFHFIYFVGFGLK